MQSLMICGNLTADPVLNEREWTNKETGEIIKNKVCNFTVAVDSGSGASKVTQYFKVNAWRTLGERCAERLKKGYQVTVVGVVILNNYVDRNNNIRAVMEIRPRMIQFPMNSKAPESVEEPDDGMPY